MWILIWFRRLREWENFCLHSSHWNGFSPVGLWVLVYVFRLEVKANVVSFTRERFAFPPVWILMCFCRLLFCVNICLQNSHSCLFALEWLFLLSFVWLSSSNDFWHSCKLSIFSGVALPMEHPTDFLEEMLFNIISEYELSELIFPQRLRWKRWTSRMFLWTDIIVHPRQLISFFRMTFTIQ